MPKPVRYCTIDDCDKRQVGQGYCRKHYSRWYKYGDPTIIKKPYRHKSPICNVDSCGQPTLAKGMCEVHYARFRRHGYTDRAQEYKGWYLKDGYIYVYTGKRRYEPLHRILMEIHIRRKLTPNENVHHIDGNRLNNAIDNLQIVTRSEHMRIHRQK